MISRRDVLKGAATVAGAVSLSGTASFAAAAAPVPAGKITRSGGRFMLNGSPVRLTGLNYWPGAVSTWCRPPNYDGRSLATLPADLASIRAGAPHVNIARVWFLQQFALHSGARDWTGLDSALAACHSHGFKVAAVLEDCWGYERGTGHTPLSASWFQSGYKNMTLAKEAEPYRQWVRQVVTRYAADPRIAIWELLNEPNTDSADLASFTADVAPLVKSADSLTPVSLGEVVPDSRADAVAAVDCFSYHYYTVYGQDNYSGAVALSDSLGKPWYLGELGFPYSDPNRPADFSSVLSGAFSSASHARGALLWQFANQGGDQFNIGSGDPSLGVIDGYATR